MLDFEMLCIAVDASTFSQPWAGQRAACWCLQPGLLVGGVGGAGGIASYVGVGGLGVVVALSCGHAVRHLAGIGWGRANTQDTWHEWHTQ